MEATRLIWPNFYIIGAEKCGTTSLWSYLRQHPDVFFPKVKEPYFFDRIRSLAPSLSGALPDELREYQELYSSAQGYRAIGDATPIYLIREHAAEQIHQVCPTAKIVVILRDPVERAYAHYLMPSAGAVEKYSFQDALKQENNPLLEWPVSNRFIRGGLYYEPVRKYQERFGAEQLKIFLFDDLKRNPNQLLTAIASHIGVDPESFSKAESLEARNSYKKPRFWGAYKIATSLVSTNVREKMFPDSLRQWLASSPLLYESKKPPISKDDSRFLQEIYEPDICRLETLIDRKLPELRRSWV